MGFLLETSALLSRKLRVNQIAQKFDNLLDGGASESIRKISSGIKFLDEYDQGGTWIDRTWGITKGVFGLLTGLAKGIVITASTLVSWVRAGWNWIVNFDWNAADQSFIDQMNNANNTLAATWGGFIGELTGTAVAIAAGYGLTIAIGAGINAFLPVVGTVLTKQLARAVAIETLKERVPELWDSFVLALGNSFRVVFNNLAMGSYVVLRRLMKASFPENEWIQKWGTGDRWTIASSFENWVEGATGIQWFNQALEEAAEEFDEAFWETSFIYAQNLDQARAQAKIVKEEVLGDIIPQVTIELDPDSSERLILPNQPSNLAQTQVLSTIATYRQIRNRDIGYFSGEPIKEESRRFNFLRTGKVIFYASEKPPFGTKQRSQISLKDLKPNLKWRDFKAALEPYNWGNYFVWVTLNRSRHEIGAWFSSISEGKRYLTRLVDLLINDTYIAMDSKIEVERNKYVKKTDDIQLMYPAFLTITIKTPVTDREDATHDLAGNSYEKDLNKIPLWVSSEPPLNTLNNTEFLT